MTSSTFTLQTAEVQELNDKELGQVSGGWWFLIPVFSKIAVVAIGAIASHFASEGSKKIVKGFGGSDAAADVAGEITGLI